MKWRLIMDSEPARKPANTCMLVIFGIAGNFSDSKVYITLKNKLDALAASDLSSQLKNGN
jgi:hypothetical protein